MRLQAVDGKVGLTEYTSGQALNLAGHHMGFVFGSIGRNHLSIQLSVLSCSESWMKWGHTRERPGPATEWWLAWMGAVIRAEIYASMSHVRQSRVIIPICLGVGRPQLVSTMGMKSPFSTVNTIRRATAETKIRRPSLSVTPWPHGSSGFQVPSSPRMGARGSPGEGSANLRASGPPLLRLSFSG